MIDAEQLFPKDQIEKFGPKDLQNRMQEAPLNSVVVKYEKGEGSTILEEPICSFWPKQEFKIRWLDAVDRLEKVLSSTVGPFKIYFELPQDDRGIYTIKAWRE